MALSRLFLEELTTVQIIIGIVVSLILVAIWQKVFDNFFFGTLGMDKTSAYQTFILAFAVTIFFLVFLYYVESFARDLVLGGAVGRTRTHALLDANDLTDVEVKGPCGDEDDCCCDKDGTKRRRSHRRRERPTIGYTRTQRTSRNRWCH